MKEWLDLFVKLTGVLVFIGFFSIILIGGYFYKKNQISKYPEIPINEIEDVNDTLKLCTIVNKPDSSHDDYVKIQLNNGEIYKIDKELYENNTWENFVNEINVGDNIELKVWGKRIVEIRARGKIYLSLEESNHLYAEYNEAVFSQRKVMLYIVVDSFLTEEHICS